MFRYLLLLFFINISFSAYAIDLAGQYTSENFNCLYKNGVHQSIIRAYHSYGKIDSDAKNNIFYSNKAGLATDAYMFPCRGKNATLQVSELI